MHANVINNINLELTQRSRINTLPATVNNVKRTCFEYVNTPDCLVRIDESRLVKFVNNVDRQAVKRPSHFMDVPIQFQDVYTEVNFHVILHLFNFGHGFRHQLHKIGGRGAWQTMLRGIVAWHLNTDNRLINANTMLDLSQKSIDEYFQFPPRKASTEAQMISPLRDMILQVAHSSGKCLIDLGYTSFVDFIFDHSSGARPSALTLVERLADNFPAFDDRRALSGGKEVLFLKKAQIAVAELYQRFEKSLSAQIAFEDTKQFTVVCDNVLPCVLRSLGILRLDKGLEYKIDHNQLLPAGEDEAQLRASAICATQIILRKANGAFWSKELGDYLWTLGKDKQFRNVERHATIDTCFY